MSQESALKGFEEAKTQNAIIEEVLDKIRLENP